MRPIFRKLLFAFFLCGFFVTNAQYTEVINSNKPGFSESPYAVGKGVYQIESNLFYRNTSIEPTFSIPQSFGTDILIRTSFFSEKLEFNAQLAYQRDKVAFKNIFTSQYYTTGLSKLNVGVKYLIFHQKYTDKSKEIRSWKRRHAFDKRRLVPSIALYLGVNTDAVNDVHKLGKPTPRLGILFQNDLTRDFNIISNFFYDSVSAEFFEYSYVVTATQNFSNRWSAFIESQGIFRRLQNNNNIGLGFAYLFSKDLQINTSLRYLIEGSAEGFYSGLGFSYRIDKHKDSFKELDQFGKEIKETPITRYNKEQKAGFFSRIFSVFKKKEKKRTRKRPKRKRKRN